MKVYVALRQPDGDWDHQATLLGVFSTRQAAEQRIKGEDEDAYVFTCELDTPMSQMHPRRT